MPASLTGLASCHVSSAAAENGSFFNETFSCRSHRIVFSKAQNAKKVFRGILPPFIVDFL